MNRRVKQLIKKFALFIVLFILRHLADYLPDALWSLVIQIGLDRKMGNHEKRVPTKTQTSCLFFDAFDG